jgi:hypothetical protein
MKLVILILFGLSCKFSYSQRMEIFGTSSQKLISELITVMNSFDGKRLEDTIVSIMDSDYQVIFEERGRSYFIHVESGGREIYDLEMKGSTLRIKSFHIDYSCNFNLRTLRIISIFNNDDSQPCKVFYKRDGSIRRVVAENEKIEKAAMNRFAYNKTKDFVASTAPMNFIWKHLSR